MSFGDNGEDEGVLAVRELVGAVRVLPDVVFLHNKFGLILVLHRAKPGLVHSKPGLVLVSLPGSLHSKLGLILVLIHS